jgi:ABC-type lipoprotein release transport system permease subunit
MEELFGVPTEQVMWVLLAVFGGAALILGLSALRNRVSFRMAARNLPRPRTQTILVVLGLMLATMLFFASSTTRETLTNSLRVQSLENLGQVDVQAQAKGSNASGQQQFGHRQPRNAPTTSTRSSRTKCATGFLTRTASRALLRRSSRPSS